MGATVIVTMITAGMGSATVGIAMTAAQSKPLSADRMNGHYVPGRELQTAIMTSSENVEDTGRTPSMND